jgi:hypothetical protein
MQIKALMEAMEKRGMNKVGLLEAYRVYLVRHLTAPRCADSSRVELRLMLESIPTAYGEAQAAGNPGAYFNDTLRVDPVPPLSVEEQTPAREEGEAKGLKVCDSAECKAAGAQYRDLVMKSPGVAYTPAERESSEWQGKLKTLLSAMSDWKEDTGYSAAEHFRFKVAMYSDLLAVVPPGASRDAVLRATHDFLRQSRLDAPNRIEWFLPVNVLIGRVGVDPLGLARLGEELSASGDAVIALFARLERAAPRNPQQIVSLF